MRLILSLCFALALFGCSSTKQLSKSSDIVAVVSSKVVHQSDSVATSKKEISAETLENLNSSEDLEIEIKVYDTNKPIDSITGKPPLKQEIKAKKNKQTKAESKHNEIIRKKDSTATSKRDTTAQYKWFKQNQAEQVQKETKYIFPWWGILGGIVFALLTIGVIKLWKSKFWNRR